MSSSPEHALIAILLAESTVTDVVSDRITAGELGNADLASPHLVVRLQALDEQHNIDGATNLGRYLMTVYCVAKTAAGAIALEQVVTPALNDYGPATVSPADADDVDVASIRRAGMQQSPVRLGSRDYARAVNFSMWARIS